MKIIIREGSAAKNFEALHTLFRSHPGSVMLCSDDKHPDDLLRGHINQLVQRALNLGYDLFDILSAACLHPIQHYNLNVGSLQVGDPADMILVNNLNDFEIKNTWIDGNEVYNGDVHLPAVDIPIINRFHIDPIKKEDLRLIVKDGPANIIVAINGALITQSVEANLPAGEFEADIVNDILKIVVVNRYEKAPVSKGLIKGFGMKLGAIASSVAHDSHNIVAVGTNDHDLLHCINHVIHSKGGVAATLNDGSHVLPLPIGGLMSDEDAHVVGDAYERIDHFVKTKLGSTLTAPYMTLSFMALLVIPSLKLSDKGLFDGNAFQLVSLQ